MDNKEILKELSVNKKENDNLVILLMYLFHKPDTPPNVSKYFWNNKEFKGKLRQQSDIYEYLKQTKKEREERETEFKELSEKIQKLQSKQKIFPSAELKDEIKKLKDKKRTRLRIFCKSLEELGLIEEKEDNKFYPNTDKIAKLIMETIMELRPRYYAKESKVDKTFKDVKNQLTYVFQVLKEYDIQIFIKGKSKPLSNFVEHLELFTKFDFTTLITYLGIISQAQDKGGKTFTYINSFLSEGDDSEYANIVLEEITHNYLKQTIKKVMIIKK